MPVEERVDAFMKRFEEDAGAAYPVSEFYYWHGHLTGSCAMGRDAFAKNNGINKQGSMCVREFLTLTQGAYGGEIIRMVEERFAEDRV